MLNLPNESVLRHVVDVHCHPTDAPSISPESMERLKITICAMATMKQDQQRVRDLATAYPDKVIPCFGYHPWFSHLISTHPELSKEEHYRRLFLDASSATKPDHVEAFEKLLKTVPDPIPLENMVADLRQSFDLFPRAMLGEVGLDHIFRVPLDYFASPRELTPFNIPLDHQLAVLEAQLDLAVELERNVSMHSVKSQLPTVNLLAKMQKKHSNHWYKISVDMHSCGLSSQTWREIEKKHQNIFLSVSTVINGRHANHKALIASCTPHRILVESDYNNVDMVTEQTWDMLCTVAEVKGWPIEQDWKEDLDEENWGAVRRLEENWHIFRRGNHQPPCTKSKKRIDQWESDSEDPNT